ncbi:MAG TPA: hypothetical protein DCZ03_12405 [Gammaproteobacteria bacterium]|nr:hypothetical protein [Gammaproteobacteria bacterium]
MKNDSPSRTALWVTFLRAAADASPDINLFPDPIAKLFLPKTLKRLATSALFHRLMKFASFRIQRTERLRKVRPYWALLAEILMRARFAEDLLQQRIEEGVTQYIILGAGLDSFVFRYPELLSRVHVYELDHPASQAHKLSLIQRAGLTVPEGVTYLPIDFEKSSVSEVLSQSNFDPNQATLICWNGVSYYLTKSAVKALFLDLAEYCGDKVEIVFDYADGKFFQTKPVTWRQKIFEGSLRFGREPLLTGFYLQELEQLIQHCGFELVKNVPGKEQDALFSPQERGILFSNWNTHFAHIRGIDANTQRQVGS